MRSINVREARSRFSELVDAAEHGQSVLITRHGKQVARVGPAGNGHNAPLPDLSDFRQAIQGVIRESAGQTIGKESEPLSKTVIDGRRQGRF